jgi:hypothetical protein
MNFEQKKINENVLFEDLKIIKEHFTQESSYFKFY